MWELVLYVWSLMLSWIRIEYGTGGLQMGVRCVSGESGDPAEDSSNGDG